MLSCSFVTAGQAEKYFEHTQDYYTKNMTNYDKWHGTLAEAYGLKGELSKEQFDELLKDITNNGRKRAGLDCTFSAPKSVSLATAKDESTRLDMIQAHQEAVRRIADKIEIELLQTRTDGKTIFSRNAIMGEFLHTMARPTESKDKIPDLDLHSHLVIMNKTTADGKDLAVDYEKILDHDKIKEYGLIYRQELAKELQAKGYVLEITDSRQGFFELKGFDRDTVMEYSSRRKEILKTADEHNMNDMQKANQYSRLTKDEGKADYDAVLEQTKTDLFDTGKIQIEKHERTGDNDRQGTDGDNGEIHLYEDQRGQRGNTVLAGNEGNSPLKEFASKPSLSDLPSFNMDDEGRRVNLLLSESTINRLAKFQSAKVRDYYMQCEEKHERLARIDEIARDTIDKLSKEKFAFTVPEARHRIMAAGVLEAITEQEAKAAMERAELVKLGRMERDGEQSKDVFLTTESNMKIEKEVTERVKKGKGVIAEKVLTMEESQYALDRVEAQAAMEGRTDFTITDRDGESGEQAAAVHHVLVSNDRYVCVDGLAGTGKTTMMQRLKWIADEQGITIKGVCFTGKAADGLEQDSGIASTTIHSFLNKLERSQLEPTQEQEAEAQPAAPSDRSSTPSREQQDGIKQEWDFSRVQKCQGREIWAVDEAGLVDMHLMNQLQKAAEARNAQILLLGDPDQLPPVGAGEPLRQMEESGMATAHLYDIRRQKDKELLEAVRESVQGDHIKTFEVLDKKGDYREEADGETRTAKIKDEMTAGNLEEYKNNLLLVSTNKDRKKYNEAIRAEYIRRGELSEGESFKITTHDGEKDRTEKRHFAAGDRIIFTANDNRLGIKNGMMAAIEHIDGQDITARTDGGDVISWNMGKYNSVDHGYAVTNYKAQGMTVQKVVADMNTKGNAQTRNALYVDISRAKTRAVIYTDDKARLEKQTKAFAKKVTSKDFARRMDEMRKRGGISNNDRYQAPDRNQAQALQKALAQIQQHTKPPFIQAIQAKQAVRAAGSQQMDNALSQPQAPIKMAGAIGAVQGVAGQTVGAVKGVIGDGVSAILGQSNGKGMEGVMVDTMGSMIKSLATGDIKGAMLAPAKMPLAILQHVESDDVKMDRLREQQEKADAHFFGSAEQQPPVKEKVRTPQSDSNYNKGWSR